MQCLYFPTAEQATAKSEELRAEGKRAYVIPYRADWFEVRSWD